jgi:hypothetical protein
MSENIYSILLKYALRTERLSYTNERGILWQHVIIIPPEKSLEVMKLLENYSEIKKKLTKLLVSGDSHYWIPHEIYDWIPIWVCPHSDVSKVTIGRAHSYFSKTLSIDEPDSRIVKKYERLLMLASKGVATGIPILKLEQKLEEALQTPLRTTIEKKIAQNFKGSEREVRLENLRKSKVVMMTDFLNERKRLRASWKCPHFSKSRILPNGLSLFFSSEDSVRSDSKIPGLLAQAKQEQSHVGEYFFPSSLQT